MATGADAQRYIDEALAAGIPIESIQAFLSRNPGDHHRILLSLAGPREQVIAANPGISDEAARAFLNTLPQSYFVHPGFAQPVQNVQQTVNQQDREVISSLGTQGWGDFISGIGDLFPPGNPIGDVISLIPKLPLPGGKPPALPPGTPPIINIPPIPTGGGGAIAGILGRLSASRIAKIAAAAAALGLTVEQYLQMFPNAARTSRRMNVLNPRALRRSLRRVGGFEKFARKTVRFNVTKRFKKTRKR